MASWATLRLYSDPSPDPEDVMALEEQEAFEEARAEWEAEEEIQYCFCGRLLDAERNCPGSDFNSINEADALAFLSQQAERLPFGEVLAALSEKGVAR